MAVPGGRGGEGGDEPSSDLSPSPLTTRKERERARGGTLRALVYVLRYDDLLEVGTRPFALDGELPLVLGRATHRQAPAIDPASELRIHDEWLSRSHAALERRGADEVVVRDLGSSNGTFVNGEPIVERVLADHDLIEVGHNLFCYRVVDRPNAMAFYMRSDTPALGPTRTWSPELASTLDTLQRVAPLLDPILVLGETGAGKESAAAAIHEWSGRAGALRVVDCGAVPEALLESTFFGHRRGAFTGATEPNEGEIVRASGGTLFLDEVGNLTSSAQAKLLRVIEEGCVTALGASEATSVDVRWVAATNRDVFADAEQGAFRPDLLRRLAGCVARLPPLRHRREDLGVIVARVLGDVGVARATIEPTAARALFTGALPGNIRELRAALRGAAALAGTAAIDLSHLERAGFSFTPSRTPASGAGGGRGVALPSRDDLDAALRACRGNVVRAARAIGAHPRQVYRLIERYGLVLDEYRRA